MKTRSYQIALAAAIACSVLLAVALAYVLFGRNLAAKHETAEDPVLARGPQSGTHGAPVESKVAEPALAPVQLTPQRMQQIGVTFAQVEQKDVSDTLHVPGNVDVNEQRIAYVQTRFPGWIQKVYANATYQYVRKGERLFTIYSPELVSSQQEYLLARKNQSTFSKDAHGMAVQESNWLAKAAEERLRQYDIPQQELTSLEETGKVNREIGINSPVSGYILERNALPNAYVQPDTKLYTIADLSSVWVYANVFQSDIGRLKPGDTARVTVDAYPGRTFNGRIDQILPQVDATTRTVRVRLVFSNPGLVLKPGMFVNADISAHLGRQLVAPASAILQSGTRSIAFVDRGGGELEPRTLQTGPQLGDSIVILGGLSAGDRIVRSANFLVDSEAQLQAAMEGYAPAAQPQPAASATKPAQQLHIEMTSDPNPPRRGANTIRVKLTNADGKVATGYEVKVNFYMAAMPAMGMAAIRASATLAEKGSGMYEAPLTLSSGGTWEVTVTVTSNGQVVSKKQLSIDATGGMG